MKQIKRALAAAVAVTLAFSLSPPAASAAAWSSSDRWGTWTNSGYTVRNDVWGDGHGPQTISADSYSRWNVWANHPDTGGVKSYPHAAKAVNKRLSAIGSLSSSYNVSVPGSGAYATAYDIWADNNAFEVMLWMTRTGPVGPLGTFQVRASTGGHTWDVYRGSNGHNAVFSFVRTSNASSGTVDVKAVLNWIRTRGWWGDVTLGEVQFGYEITSSSGGRTFTTNSYSVSGG
ncbi:GH12 family glycosyl hydrolase domain-containing protein [Lentzea sp.]|uniref:GH12 family glycosyl hydrolase domain-containing protein n=1 Tax=Lentzea sp. TaxID=56099 RepID=UPI002ED4E583